MASTVDAAILALVALLEAAPALTGVSVFDGPPTEEAAEWIAVGWSPNEVTAVDVSYEWASLGARSQDEAFDILCTLRAGSGDPGIASQRARAVALRDAIAAGLASDVTLAGTVREARISTAALVQELTERGPVAGYTFRVSCQAQIAS